MVRKGGLEPPWIAPPDPKSGASANSATFALIIKALYFAFSRCPLWCPFGSEFNQPVYSRLIVVRAQMGIPHGHLDCTVPHQLGDGSYGRRGRVPDRQDRTAGSAALQNERPAAQGQPPDVAGGARLNKPRRLLLELKRVTSPLRLRHLRYPFALEQLAKGYVLRGQGQGARDPLDSTLFSSGCNSTGHEH